jgi:hypothetical protein
MGWGSEFVSKLTIVAVEFVAAHGDKVAHGATIREDEEGGSRLPIIAEEGASARPQPAETRGPRGSRRSREARDVCCGGSGGVGRHR